MHLFTLRSLLSSVLVSMTVLAALTSNIVEAKKCKAKKPKNSGINLGISANVSTSTGVSLSVGSKGKSKPFFGGKAGVSGYDSVKLMQDCIYWVNDWSPDPLANNEAARKAKHITGVSMLWGLGLLDTNFDRKRFHDFMKLPKGKYKAVAYLNEFDFQGSGSCGVIPVKDAVAGWEKYIAPHREAGSLLIGPSCAMQDHEKMCTQFVKSVTTKVDAVNLHIFKDTPEGVQTVLDHYRKLGYPMVITELACINYEGGASGFCNQKKMYDWWPRVIEKLENDPDVVAWATSDADNGPAAKLTKNDGKALSETGEIIKREMCKYRKRD